MVDLSAAIQDDFGPQAPQPVEPRERRRRDSLKINKQAVADRISKFYTDDIANTVDEREARLQRYAKLRMWTEGKDWPWEDSSDIGLPDIMEKSLRTEDTLHNAVMQQRPVVSANAIHKGDKNREPTIDALIDTQVFREQPGEQMIAEASNSFVNDPAVVIFTPWIHEEREVAGIKIFPPIPVSDETSTYLRTILTSEYPGHRAAPMSKGPWDWRLSPVDDDSDAFTAKFYTRQNGDVEMSTKRLVTVFDGPRPIVKDYDDVLAPVRAANLHIPGPSNPGGASHVILRDYPEIDEIARLIKNGTYDLVDKNDSDQLGIATRSGTDEDEQEQKDALAGKKDNPSQDIDKSHRTLTRLICFDMFDIDGDGIDEDVVWWFIVETKTLLRGRLLGELHPGTPPRRPLDSASFLPVKGRWSGISLPELAEGLHDAMKMALDQMVDAGTLTNVPPFFYRPHGSLKPEVMRYGPGEGYPLSDPQRDVFFPTFSNNGQAFQINLLTILGQFEERVTEIGPFQLGRVPAGGSSALRTIGGMSLLAGQGEARPERILRRFFMLLTGVWGQIHNLNTYFLPKKKQFQLADPKPGEEAYLEIDSRADIDQPMRFTFSANVLNTSKQALQESLQQIMAVLINPLALQMGLVDGDKVYRLLRDFIKAMGQNPDDYMIKPSPDADKPRMLATEAINLILSGGVPDGVPLEVGGWIEHLQLLLEYAHSDEVGLLNGEQVKVFGAYVEAVRQRAIDQQRQIQLQQAAAQFGQGQAQGQPGAPTTTGPQADPNTNPQVSGGAELIDESIPGAGGGGAAG